MKEFIRINPTTGRPIGAKILRKANIRYQYRDVETCKFIGKNEFRRRYRVYKNSLKRKDKRTVMISDKACGYYTNAERMLLKKACNVEICGVWAEPTNIKYNKGVRQ